MLPVCAALRACHDVGIVHRDLKPSNIFLAETDTGPAVKVLDFGVSKAPIAGNLTQEGQILGTPQYLSPEQVNGRVGPESDQYALGVLLYVCLTKRLPFEEHQNLSLLRAIDVGQFPSPSVYRADLPEQLEAVVFRAMHVNPKQRFESVHALGQALWSFASPRGQLEWQNYYFHAAPPVSPQQSTLPVVPPRSMPRTEILPTPPGTPGLTTPQQPQMMKSTRMASKPTPPRVEAPDYSVAFQRTEAPGGSKAALWAVLGLAAAAAVVAGVLWKGRSQTERPSRPTVTEHPGIAPDPLPAPPPVARVAPPPAKPEPIRQPDVAETKPQRPERPRDRPNGHNHGHPHGHGQGQPTGTGTGMDGNGIGIPSD